MLLFANFLAFEDDKFWVSLGFGLAAGMFSLLMFKLIANSNRELAPPKKTEARYDPFLMGSPREKRESFRRGGTAVEVFFSFPDDKKKSRKGWVFDRSSGGLGMIVPEAIPANAMMVVLPVNAPEMTPWVEIEVRTSRKVDDGYELGCKFLRTPPWSILLMFG